MKNLIAAGSLLLMSIQFVNAQRPTRQDTVWGNFRNQAFYNSILNATVVSGETQSINIIPNRGPFCFDKKIIIKSIAGSLVANQCIYLDTKGGLIGLVKPVTTVQNNMCDILPNDIDFSFSIIGLKGNIFIYHNTEKNGRVEHWVRTGNTENYQYQSPSSPGYTTLNNKNIRKRYCNNKISAVGYRYADPASPTLYLFGKSFPATMKITSKKYLGAFGVGYQHTDKGLFIIMENLSSNYNSTITDIEDVNICFDPSPFQVMEDEFVSKRRLELQKERDKIARDEARIGSGPCAAQQRNILVFRRAQLRLQEVGLAAMQQGNLYQDNAAQQASLNMMDPLFMVQGNILETQFSICNTEELIRTSPSSNLNASLNCLQNLLVRLHGAESEMSSLDARYATEPAKAMGEKSKVYLRLMQIRCD